jgi:hypothetical protein
MLRNLHYSPGWHHTPHEAHLTDRSVLSTFWGAFREALTASRRYHSLRSRGLSHDTASREALGIGASSSQATRMPARSLCFAGKA